MPHALDGVVPPEWLRPETLVLENDCIIVSLHHKPSRLGHCVIFPKKRHCRRLQDMEEDDMVAMGLAMVLVKRALRLVTGYRSYLFLIRSGLHAGQIGDHLYADILPTIAAQPSYSINWDPNNAFRRGSEIQLTTQAAAKLVHVLRQSMGLYHFTGYKNMIFETDRIIAELVQAPCSVGHFTVSPKAVSPDLEDASPHDVSGCLRDLPRVARAMEKSIGQTDFFVVVQNGRDAGQVSPHLNVQCIPFNARKKAVIITLNEGKEPEEESANKLAEALRAITGTDVFLSAVGKQPHPQESAWQKPVMRGYVNPAGISSPYVARARSPHPHLEPWAKVRGVNDTPTPRSPFVSNAARMLEDNGGRVVGGPGVRAGVREEILRELAELMQTNHTLLTRQAAAQI